MTDSEYCINCLTWWGVDVWPYRNWTNARGYPVANEYLIKGILDSMDYLNVSRTNSRSSSTTKFCKFSDKNLLG